MTHVVGLDRTAITYVKGINYLALSEPEAVGTGRGTDFQGVVQRIRAEAAMFTRSRLLTARSGREELHADTTQPRDRHPRHGAAGGPLRDPVATRKRLPHEPEGEKRWGAARGLAQGALVVPRRD